MYRTLQFRSSWRNEWAFDRHENPVSPGARGLADALVTELRKQLRQVTEVSQHSFYGWGFTTEFDHSMFDHVLNPVDQVYLTVEYRRFWLHWLLLRRPGKRFDEYFSLLTDSLKRIPGVSDVQSVLRMTKRSRPLAEPGAPPNGGLAMRPGNSGASGGPPSVS